MLKIPVNDSLLPYRDIYKGESAVLYGTGKTLYSYSMSHYDENSLRVVLNRAICHEELAPTHWFFGDFHQSLHDAIPLYPTVMKFVHNTYYTPEDVAEWGTYYRIHRNVPFRKDIHLSYLINHSVAFSAMQILLYTGVKNIKIVGCDGNYSTGSWQVPAAMEYHYTDAEARAFDRTLLKGWRILSLFAKECYPDVRIEVERPVVLADIFPEKKRGPFKIF